MRFRIYYSDGTYYDGATTEDAMAAPTMGALVVKQEAPSNTCGYSTRSATLFCWEKKLGRWGGKDDQLGLSRYWATEAGAQKVLQGEEVDDSIYQGARSRAADDGYLDRRKQ